MVIKNSHDKDWIEEKWLKDSMKREIKLKNTKDEKFDPTLSLLQQQYNPSSSGINRAKNKAEDSIFNKAKMMLTRVFNPHKSHSKDLGEARGYWFGK